MQISNGIGITPDGAHYSAVFAFGCDSLSTVIPLPSTSPLAKATQNRADSITDNYNHNASILCAAIGSFIAPLFRPLGFGDWRVSTALITGFTAKESVVSTLTVLLGGDTAALTTLFTPFTAIVFLVFTLLYTPCVAAIAAVKRELGGARAAAGVVLMQCGIAWIVAFVVHCVGTVFGLV